MLKNNLVEILDLKRRFIGAKKGFQFLDLLLDNLKKHKKNQITKKIKDYLDLNIYDYRIDSTFIINVEYNILYNDIQSMYIKFLIKEKFNNYPWFVSFRSCIYSIFNRDHNIYDDFSEIIISILTESFIFFFDLKNEIEITLIKKYVILRLLSLTEDESESINYTNFLFESLIKNKLFNLNENRLSINDIFIYYDFCTTSLNIVPFFSKNNFDLKYSCNYGLESLTSVIDYYLSYMIYNESFEKSLQLFSYDNNYKECFPFLMNYDDDVISKIPVLSKPYEELFKAYFFKKLMLNEYCFHIIIMSCFENYFFDSRIKNILMEKADPKLKFCDNITLYV